MSTRKTAIIVEDDILTAEALAMAVRSLGVEVLALAATAERAEREAKAHDPDIVFMDVRLGPGRDGVDASMSIGQFSAARIVFVTASKEPETMARIRADHPFRILIKPFDFAELQEAVAAA